MSDTPASSGPTPAPSIHLHLTQEEYNTLMFTIGYAAGSAQRDKQPKLLGWVIELGEAILKQVVS